MSPYVFLTLRLIVAAASGLLILYAWRAIRHASPLFGYIVAAGLLMRAWTALLLFVIAFLDLPVLASLHTPDGFWELAPDARIYYERAVEAVDHGLARIHPGSASPMFVRALALWMGAVGVSPVSPVLFNIVVYLGTCWLLVIAARRLDVPGPAILPGLIGLSFSPVLLLCSTQVLKDIMFIGLIVAAAMAARAALARGGVTGLPSLTIAGVITASGVLFGAVYLMAGIRPYYAVFVWLGLALACGWTAIAGARSQRLASVGRALPLLAGVWVALMWGAGPYYDQYDQIIRDTVNATAQRITSRDVIVIPERSAAAAEQPQTVARTLDAKREGFVWSGGGTNLVKPAAPRGAEDPESAGLAAKLAATSTGLAALFVPISLLRALSIVSFDGGRGFLMVTDIDTLFFGMTATGVLVLLMRHRQSLRAQMPYLIFVGALVIISAVLLAYVVTNYGTLFRLRQMVFAPVWLLAFAIGPQTASDTAPAALSTAVADPVTPVPTPEPERAPVVAEMS